MTGTGLTMALAEQVAGLRLADVPPDVQARARHCILDWFGVTIAGSREPVARLLQDLARADASPHGCTVVGATLRVPLLLAALANGTASHALDFDDVNPAMIGHPSVAVLGAALALGEQLDSSADDLLRAFIAGYETACRVAVALGPGPYQRGFHATGTVGTLGAAAAGATLLGLDAHRTATALGLAATQAAGLKCMIGTMAKPLHAGKACTNGLLAAQLAELDFLGTTTAIESDQGLAAAMGGTCDTAVATAQPAGGWHLANNLFKYHASCFMTHSTIDGIADIRATHGIDPDDVTAVVVHISELERRACTIAEPATGLEVKFSIPHLAAMALRGDDFSVVDDATASDPQLIRLRQHVTLVDDGTPGTPTLVELHCSDGTRLTATHDHMTPEPNLPTERHRLTQKFTALATPVIGPHPAAHLLTSILTGATPVRDLLHHAEPVPIPQLSSPPQPG